MLINGKEYERVKGTCADCDLSWMSTECATAKACGDHTMLKEKKQMFKVGDYVEVVDDELSGFYKSGDKATILEASNQMSLFMRGDNGKEWFIQACYIKPASRQPVIKVGDRALFSDDGVNWCEGEYRGLKPATAIRAWNHIKPLPRTETRVKKASEIVKWLEDNWYEFDSDGHWTKNRISFVPRMFQYCGKQKPDSWKWLPEWLEEVEI